MSNGRLTFGSLFAGIGGIDLGFERAGMECVWQVERDDFCDAVLERHWPGVCRWGDVCSFPPCSCEECLPRWRVDVLAAGFPCQDLSRANPRGDGLDGHRSGLFWQVDRIIGLLRPRVVVLENVPALIDGGLDRVLGALAVRGYDAEWDTLPAAAFGACHRRERIFVVAHAGRIGPQGVFSGQVQRFSYLSSLQACGSTAGVRARPDLPEPLFHRDGNGVPRWVDVLGGLGNAVVPQVAEWIGKRIVREVSRW